MASKNESAGWNYGRLSAGYEENVSKIAHARTMGALASVTSSSASATERMVYTAPMIAGGEDVGVSDLQSESISSFTRHCWLLSLPTELIDEVCKWLGPQDLLAFAHTCQKIQQLALTDTHWRPHVQHNIPGVVLDSPAPCKSYVELFLAHDPTWFLPRHKIWFSDARFHGKIIIIRYDPRRGCIEGYTLVAERGLPTYEPWEFDDEVLVHHFSPRVHLHLDKPALQLSMPQMPRYSNPLLVNRVVPTSFQGITGNPPQLVPHDSTAVGLDQEIPMQVHDRNGAASTFFLAKACAKPHLSSMELWPPLTIEANNRVRSSGTSSRSTFKGAGHRPQNHDEVCDTAFRIRRWMNMTFNTLGDDRHLVHNHGRLLQLMPGPPALSEDLHTFATLDPKLYTPTTAYPWRGIWVGDYSGHGCEFLLMHQPEQSEDHHNQAALAAHSEQELESSETATGDARVHRGPIHAIKLTGDPNIPRGEETFVAEDIGADGFVRYAKSGEFKGARIVRSRGHIAERFFRNDKWVESQLIMISENKLAQYWVGFGHISFYERVDIDKFLNPFSDPHFAGAAG